MTELAPLAADDDTATTERSHKLRNLGRAFVTMAVAGVSFLGIPPTPVVAQVDQTASDIWTPDNPDVEFSVAWQWQMYRRQSGSRFYGLELNTDYYVGGPPPAGCLAGGTVRNDKACEVYWLLTNTTDSAITGVDAWSQTLNGIAALTGGVGGGVGGFSASIEPGETGTLSVWLEFRPIPGFYEDTVRVTANNGQAFEVDLSYEILPSSPSYPVGVGTVRTGGELSIFWSPPEFDGGSAITGYVGELISLPTTGHVASGNVWWTERVEACNFRGRPGLLICDMPNNNLTRIEAGDYIVAVQALSVFDSKVDKHFNVSFTDTITLPTLSVTPPTPTPTPVPAPTPVPVPTPVPAPTQTPAPPEVVIVVDYVDAPNLISLVHAGNFSDKYDAPVLRLYQAFFNRSPDLAGAKYWLGIRRQGYGLLQIAGFMAQGREFADNYRGNSDSQYLTAVYSNVLGRAYDQGGFDYWLVLLVSDQLDRVEVVFYVTQNVEFINNYPFTKPRLR